MKILLLLTTILCFTTCSTEEDPLRNYPIVLTKEVSNVLNNSATFSCDILSVSSGISDHGFIWTREGFPTLTNNVAEKKSLGALSQAGLVQFTTPAVLEPGKTYSMRAYVLSGQYTVYSKVLSFTSK